MTELFLCIWLSVTPGYTLDTWPSSYNCPSAHVSNIEILTREEMKKYLTQDEEYKILIIKPNEVYKIENKKLIRMRFVEIKKTVRERIEREVTTGYELKEQ